MTMHNLVKIAGVAAVLSCFAVSTADAKSNGFVNKVGCYAAMNVKCSGGKCSDDEYNEKIEFCDEIFADAAESETGALQTKAAGVLKLLFKR